MTKRKLDLAVGDLVRDKNRARSDLQRMGRVVNIEEVDGAFWVEVKLETHPQNAIFASELLEKAE